MSYSAHPFDGFTIGGLKYVYTDGTERTVTIREGQPSEASEVQTILPIYTVGASVIYVQETQHTGVDKTVDGELVDVLLLETNIGGRMWARKVPQP